ncbi:Trm112 family protein [Idiomarina sp. Sol25]|uniref:Trm112 family protein n=1 Tax=Idiomarina sp. Sol25 TaxID=3064000 RepID=UPI00294A9C43|nr:Trm112 family protein [Idiomarina sp. Sol25]MDV6327146.1 Trm112 family protein [Idiomarina sp. Sol25]
MAIDKTTLAILACPKCKGKLTYYSDKDELVCRGERLAYPIDENIPVLIADKARELSSEELEEVPS